MELKESLKPLLQLSKEIDRKLPLLNHQLKDCHLSRNLSDGGLNELHSLKNEVTMLKDDCEGTFLGLEKNNQVFAEVWKCLDQSYELTEACVSIMEAKLAIKGYDPPKYISNDGDQERNVTGEESSKAPSNFVSSDEFPKNKKLEEKQSISKHPVDEETFCIAPAPAVSSHSNTAKSTTGTENLAKKTIKYDLPESPKCPLLDGMITGSKQTKADLPKEPVFNQRAMKEFQPSSQHLTGKLQSSFFDTLASPAAPVLVHSLPHRDEQTAGGLFPNISSPATPELLAESRRKPLGKKPIDQFELDLRESQEDELVMHSRASFFQGPIRSTKESPATPELVGFQEYKRVPSKVSEPHFLPSPESPDISTAQQKASPTIGVNQYDSLPSHVKRLISHSQACTALRRCYNLAQRKQSTRLSSREVEEAIGFGEKTKCAIFILQDLKLIKNVFGRDAFQLCQ